jgi:hypothetical protein
VGTLFELSARKVLKKRIRGDRLGVALPENASATAPVTSFSLLLVRVVTLRMTWLLSLEPIEAL